MKDNSEYEKFNSAMKQIMSVSHDELKRREEEWKRDKQARKKRAKTLPASRASRAKD